jgi:site-specific DNA-cytosine methylase
MERRLKCVDLFSGVGGLSLALAPVLDHVLYCDIDERCRKVLQKHMDAGELQPAPIVQDVRCTQEIVDLCSGTQIDIILSSSSCVGFSSAGHRKGLAHPETSLFGETCKLASTLRPVYVFLENVAGIAKEIPTITQMLSDAGYDMRWTTWKACDEGAWHVRKRWFALCTRKDYVADPTVIFYMQEALRAMPRYEWDIVHHPAHMIAKDPCDMKKNNELLNRLRMMGNSVVPDQARYAFVHLLENPSEFRSGTVTGGFAPPTRDGRRDTRKDITLDPALFTGRDRRAVKKASPFIERQVTSRYFMTPRHSMTHATNKLTERTAYDLPTQLRFMQGCTGPRDGYANPQFIEFLMGFPIGWTA